MSSAESFTTLSDEYNGYSSYEKTSSVETLAPLLLGETIRFSDFDPNKYINTFRYVVPDTIWIKERPKKNPKEGKHYILRYLYRSEMYETDDYSKTVKERTPAIEFVGAQFLVNEVCRSESYRYVFDVYLTNIASGEEIIWSIPNSFYDAQSYVVHLSELSDKINLTGRKLCSADKKNFSGAQYQNVKMYICTGTDVILDFRETYPFKIKFTAKDELNNEKTYTLSTSSNNYSYTGTFWFDESQYSKLIESDKTYEIDYKVKMAPLEVELPFSFRFILGKISNFLAYGGQTISPSSYSSSNNLPHEASFSKGDMIFIGDKITVRGEDFYKAALEGKAFYIRASNVEFSQEHKLRLDSLLSSSKEARDAFFEYQKDLSYYRDLTNKSEAYDEMKAFSKKGISIPYWGPYDESEYTDGTGVKFTFHNPTNKTIKYINLSFVGYNAVNDRVGKTMTRKCIGPIDPDETGTYVFEYVWFTDIVEYVKITSLSVQYMDGTIKKVPNPHSVVWSEDLLNAISKTSPVENLKSEVIKSN